MSTPLYILLNKPVDCTIERGTEIKSVFDLITNDNGISYKEKDVVLPPNTELMTIGHIETDDQGIAIITNDEKLKLFFEDPARDHSQEFEITIDKALRPDARGVLSRGMRFENDFVEGIEIRQELNKGRRTVITVRTDMKYRPIRKMFETLGYHVLGIRKIRIAKLKLGTLSIGKWKLIQRSSIM